jgi:probable H4MPT-linked C1 transfer pathway protein
MSHVVLGLDLGGANLKGATPNPGGRGVSVPFPLWKQPDRLPAALAELVAQFENVEEFAVTMTGELCDCFETKAEGVARIVAAVVSAAGGMRVRFWTTGGRFVTAAEAVADWNAVAAANWHALASFAGRFAPQGTCLLVDVGSTTTDVIPLRDGVPCPIGRTDTERLANWELVYTGVRRTPLCTLMLSGQTCAELFATSLDIHVMLGNIPEEPTNTDTADGRPATRAFAHARIARMIGGDGTTVDISETSWQAEQAADWQLGLVHNAADRHRLRFGGLDRVITSGCGEFVARRAMRVLQGEFEELSLTDRLGPSLSECAPAFAVATLAREKPV